MLLSMAAEHESLETFLTDLSLEPPDRAQNADRVDNSDQIVLSTIHSAKGLYVLLDGGTCLGAFGKGAKNSGHLEALGVLRNLHYQFDSTPHPFLTKLCPILSDS
jgi:hypothetical protein